MRNWDWRQIFTLTVGLAIAGPWMMTMLVDYIRQTLTSIPSMLG